MELKVGPTVWCRSRHWGWRAAAGVGSVTSALGALAGSVGALGPSPGTRLLWFVGALAVSSLAAALVLAPALAPVALVGVGGVVVGALAGPSEPGVTLAVVVLLALTVELAEVAQVLRGAVSEDVRSLVQLASQVGRTALLVAGGCAALLLASRLDPPVGGAAAAVVAGALVGASGLVWWSRAR